MDDNKGKHEVRVFRVTDEAKHNLRKSIIKELKANVI